MLIRSLAGLVAAVTMAALLPQISLAQSHYDSRQPSPPGYGHAAPPGKRPPPPPSHGMRPPPPPSHGMRPPPPPSHGMRPPPPSHGMRPPPPPSHGMRPPPPPSHGMRPPPPSHGRGGPRGSVCVTSRGSCPTGFALPKNAPCQCDIPGFGVKRGAVAY